MKCKSWCTGTHFVHDLGADSEYGDELRQPLKQAVASVLEHQAASCKPHLIPLSRMEVAYWHGGLLNMLGPQAASECARLEASSKSLLLDSSTRC